MGQMDLCIKWGYSCLPPDNTFGIREGDHGITQ